MDFADPHFVEPLRLWLLAPVALALAALAFRASKARARSIASLASPEMIRNLLAAHSPRRRAFKYILFATAAALVVVALARPCWGREKGDTAGDTEDVVFLLDTSRSMTARDVPPDRLTRAKRAISAFVNMHPSGRVGLVAFAGRAFLQCPPTADRDIFNETLEDMDTGVIPQSGTDIGGAIEAGYKAFGEKTDNARRTLVLLTDGEDLAGDGVETAKKLARDGVVIHAVGIGGPGYRMPEHSDGTGGMVTTHLDEQTLRDIARATGGDFFRLGAGNDGFGAVEAKLAKLATKADGLTRAVERFPAPLALAALLLAIEALLGTRRRNTPSSATPAWVVVGILLLLPATGRAESPETLYDRGAAALRRGADSEAEGWLRAALEDAGPDLRARSLYNLGEARARPAAKAAQKHLSPESPAAALPGTSRNLDKALADVTGILDRHAKGDFDAREAGQVYKKSEETHKTSLKQLKSVHEALADAEPVARKLDRAAGDFSGASELAPESADARKNAAATADYANRFARTLAGENKSARKAADTAETLKKKLAELKKLLDQKKGSGSCDNPGGEGDSKGDDKDDDAKKNEKKPTEGTEDKRTEEERRRQEGREGRLNREEALAALEQMRGALKNRVPSDFGDPDKNPQPDSGNAGDR